MRIVRIRPIVCSLQRPCLGVAARSLALAYAHKLELLRYLITHDRRRIQRGVRRRQGCPGPLRWRILHERARDVLSLIVCRSRSQSPSTQPLPPIPTMSKDTTKSKKSIFKFLNLQVTAATRSGAAVRPGLQVSHLHPAPPRLLRTVVAALAQPLAQVCAGS